MARQVILIAFVFAATTLPLRAEPPADAVKKELAKFQGTWSVIGVLENGNELTEEQLAPAMGVVIVKGDQHTLQFSGQSQGTVTVKVDPTASPKHYDLHISEGPNKGTVQKGIYELKGDVWKLCLNKKGGDRPKSFAAEAGSGQVVVTMKKQPGDKP